MEQPVVEKSVHQRQPLSGEPVCVLCGRYGEYICDQTDEDVCSLECRDLCIHRAKPQSEKIENPSPLEQKRDVTKQPDSSITLDASAIHGKCGKSELWVKQLRAKLKIEISGTDRWHPILSFTECKFPDKLMENMDKLGYHDPTPIQMQSVPIILHGNDILIRAPTGSGKTAAFVLPLVSKTANISRHAKYPEIRGIILSPTRELAIQIENVIKDLVSGIPNMKTALLVGGLPIPPQLHRLKLGVQIVVATPGRLLEIQRLHDFSMDSVFFTVVDEVDMLLELGFLSQINSLLLSLPHSRQNIFLSATISKDVQDLVTKYLCNPAIVEVSKNLTVCERIKQKVLWVENTEKKSVLFSLILEDKTTKIPMVIFVQSKDGCDLLAKAIKKKCNIEAKAFHSGKTQNERLDILTSFIDGEFSIIVSTSVLARGINLNTIQQVVNFDMPRTIEAYIHQIGRAGSIGEGVGHAISFINDDDRSLFKDLLLLLQESNVKPPRKLIQSLAPNLKKRKCMENNFRVVDESKRAFKIVQEDLNVDCISTESWEGWKRNMSRAKYHRQS